MEVHQEYVMIIGAGVKSREVNESLCSAAVNE